MSALVSIIVPVYNLEDYIENCINSLLNQTYSNIEIICIDDGSKDNSAAVIAELIKKDERIRYFYQENAGVSAARNKGLENFQGEYVMFVDGDDYLHIRAVEIFVEAIQKSKSDIVGAKLMTTDSLNENKEEIVSYDINKLDLQDIFNGLSSFVFRTVSGKIFIRNLILNNRFPLQIANGEDTVFLFKILSTNPRIAQIDLSLYFYYNRRDSISNSKFNISYFSVVDGLADLCSYLKKIGSDFLLTQAVILLFKAILSNQMLSIGSEYEVFVLKRCKQVGSDWIDYLIHSKHTGIKNKICFVLFFYSRHFYELVRVIQDPTMKDFYKNRKKNRKEGME